MEFDELLKRLGPFCATDIPQLLAVIDWELTGVGATLNDLG